ncbi:Uncharacterized protein TCM_015134 [Theobroma cacao]|uniref:Uncharacterized protein n=1 Tax=Theobroma cacao TaxID=3641 RepID=A0A061G0R7_THECC|nr:Uncharacterized protein TCM_015134 [Theobroma cacao]
MANTVTVAVSFVFLSNKLLLEINQWNSGGKGKTEKKGVFLLRLTATAPRNVGNEFQFLILFQGKRNFLEEKEISKKIDG